MSMEKAKQAVIKANCALELDRRIIGVKFVFTEEEFNKADAREIIGKLNYCVMVKSAMTGKSIKAVAGNFDCPGGARAIGVIEPGDWYLSGRQHLEMGLDHDLITAKNVINNMTLCKHRCYGVLLKPLEEYDQEPDIVLIVTNPYNAMRIVQGYSYRYGTHPSYKMAGHQALCSECTAYPFESNNINISLLCGGTRHSAGWRDDEVGIGIPFNRFATVAEGIYETINVMEPNRNKSIIEAKLIRNELSDLKLEYDQNYFITDIAKL